MSEEDDGAEKPFDATPERLRKAREKGQIAKSTELVSALGSISFLLLLFYNGGGVISQLGTPLRQLIDTAGTARPGGGLHEQAAGVYRTAIATLLMLSVPMAAALLGVVVQRAFVLTGSNLKPKLSRISPISNAKQKYGVSGLFEFAKKAVKLCLFSLLLGVFFARELETILALVHLDARQSLVALGELTKTLFALVCVIMLVLGGVDYAWQRHTHLKKNRMSLKEMRDEVKESEGDPHFKGQRRQIGQQIALNSMIRDVATADVVVVNPTHYAVALAWDRTGDSPPHCVAKGYDEIAFAIRREADKNTIPIHEDPPTARALHASLEIGDPIHPDHYLAVAAAIRFADEIRRRSKSR